MNTEIWDRAQRSIAQGALTNSKHPQNLMYGLYPTHIKHGQGCHLYDSKDRRYLDYICGLGANFFGYGNDSIGRELIKHIYGGFSHSLPTHHEVEAAEALKQIFPFAERVKFLKTGSDACAAAVKFARAANPKEEMLCLSDAYHGWHDMFVSMTPPAKGVPKHPQIEQLKLELDPEQIKRASCVIIEPVITDDSRERVEWLNRLRALCTKHQTLLIFDEVITGFRYRKFGVTNAFGIVPDLICIGKALANGLPLAAVCGISAVMDDRSVFVSSTYAGEVLSLVAAKKVVELLLKDSKYDLNHLWNLGEHFKTEFNRVSDDVKIEGYGTRGIFKGDDEKVALFFQEMAKADVLFCKSWFYNVPLTKHQDHVLDCIDTVSGKIRRGDVKLEYPIPNTPFSMEVRKKSE
jgi:glutamate-1-semialdehyde 2,1-aminomutase